MANITQWLEKIKVAIYGKDVRDAIYNSINSMNSEVVSNTSKQNDLETKYNNQIKNMSLSNPSVAEVVDARGNSFGTLGARLDYMTVASTYNLLQATALDDSDNISLWKMSSCYSIAYDKLTPIGHKCFKIENDDNSTYYSVSQQLYLLPNTTYTLSGWIRLDENAEDNENLNFQLSHYNTSSEPIWLNSNIEATKLVKGQWVYVYRTFTTQDIKGGTQVTIAVQCSKNKWHGHVGDLMLVKGKKDLDWSPSPKDILYQSRKYTTDIQKELNKRYYIKMVPTDDFSFIIDTFNVNFSKVSESENMSSATIPVSGLYNINLSFEIYNPGTSGTQSCSGDVIIYVNGKAKQTHNYDIIMENTRASCITCNFVGKLNANDKITVSISNSDPSNRTFDFRAENSWLSIYKI